MSERMCSNNFERKIKKDNEIYNKVIKIMELYE
jgi:formiminotetrahydrofolate cyclodeaminase